MNNESINVYYNYILKAGNLQVYCCGRSTVVHCRHLYMLGDDRYKFFLFILCVIQRLKNEWFENFFDMDDGNYNNIKNIILQNHNRYYIIYL